MRIPQPPDIEEARRLAVGARILVNWDAYGWFEGRVAQVDFGRDLLAPEEDPNEDINPNALYLNIQYPAQQGADRWYDADSEDRHWGQVFDTTEDRCVVLELGEGGRHLFPDYNPPVEQLRNQLLSQAPVATPAKRKSSIGRGKGKGKKPRRGEDEDSEEEEEVATRPRKRACGGGSGKGASKGGASGSGKGRASAGKRARSPPPLGGSDDDEAGPSQPRRTQQPPAALHASPQAHWQQLGGQGSQSGGGARGAGPSQQANGWAHGGGSDSEEDFRETQPSQRQRGGRGRGGGGGGRGRRPPPDYSHVPDPPGAPSKAGVLEKIEMERFMCHTHFVHEFGRRVSMAYGANGSGKSALLQGLQCCLGVRATDTGRYKALKEFVQRGYEGQAVVRLTLWNTGPDAYRRSELGPKATIVRRISSTGGSSFEVLDCTGRVALRGTKEVQALVEALGIDASNVAVVLTQDLAKSFAGNSTEKDKYKVFMSATEFDKTRECLLGAQERIAEMQAALQELDAAIERLGGELAAKEQLVERLQEVDAWAKHQQAVGAVAAWAIVLAKEQEIAALQEELGVSLPARREAAEARLASFREQLRGIEGQLDGLAHRLQESAAAGRQREQDFRRLREDLKAQKAKVHAAQKALRDSEVELETLRAEKESLEAANRDVNAELEASTQQAVDAHRQRVAAARDAMERAGVAASDARQYVAEREAAAEQAQAAHKAASRASIEAQDRLRQLEGELRRLQAAQGDRVARFGGAAAVELHRAVADAVAAGRFRQPPIQIGSQLSLSDDRWGLAVEAALRNVLDGWIVDNQADAQLLRKLRSQLRQPLDRLTVTVMPFHHPLHNIPPGALPPEDVTTCLRVLRFEEGPHAHVVKNVLIDQAAIERTVLTHTQRDALEAVRNGAFWQQYSLANAFAQDGSVAYLRGKTQISRPPPPGLRRPRLVRDVSQQVGECQRELDQARGRVAEAQAAERQAHAEAKRAREELTAAKRQQQGAERERATAKTQYDEVHSEQPLALDPEEGGEAARRLAQLGRQLLDAEVQHDVFVDELAREQEEAQRLQGRLHELKAVPRDANAQLEQWQRDIVDFGHEKRGVEAELGAVEAECAQHMAQSSALRREIHEAEEQLALMLGLAEQTSTRDEAAAHRQHLIGTWREEGQTDEAINKLLHDVPGLTQRVEAMEKKIEQGRQEGLTAAEAQRQADKLRLRIGKLRARRDTADSLCEQFERGEALRRRKFKELRGNIATALSKAFQRYLRLRNHMGSIQVNYKEERLVFEVQLDSHKEPTRNMKDLSGGERSYTSLAFILALGRVGINPPFHALDEFDVYMDQINRCLAFMFLLEFQLQHPDRQLLLFTPLDPSVVGDAKEQVAAKYGQLPDDLVKVHCLPKPRGQ